MLSNDPYIVGEGSIGMAGPMISSTVISAALPKLFVTDMLTCISSPRLAYSGASFITEISAAAVVSKMMIPHKINIFSILTSFDL